MEYKVKIDIGDIEEEDFHKNDDNLAKVNVYSKNGDDISKNCRVQITLTKNALLGLGKELIRMAHNFRDGRHYHIEPIQNNNFCETMGIVLMPESSEFIITCGDFKKKIKDFIP